VLGRHAVFGLANFVEAEDAVDNRTESPLRDQPAQVLEVATSRADDDEARALRGNERLRDSGQHVAAEHRRDVRAAPAESATRLREGAIAEHVEDHVVRAGPPSSQTPTSVHAGAALAPTEHPPGAVTDPASAPPPDSTTDVGERLTELAKEALMGADTQSLEQWAEGLLAAGEHGRFAERMQAIVRLARGDVGDALRALRAARAELDANAPPTERCQASLALGVALAVAGRPDEALLEALDALARAREQGDDKGGHACLAFLSKLFATVDRPEDANRLRRITRNIKNAPAPPAPV
jgi:hypothetical protein